MPATKRDLVTFLFGVIFIWNFWHLFKNVHDRTAFWIGTFKSLSSTNILCIFFSAFLGGLRLVAHLVWKKLSRYNNLKKKIIKIWFKICRPKVIVPTRNNLLSECKQLTFKINFLFLYKIKWPKIDMNDEICEFYFLFIDNKVVLSKRLQIVSFVFLIGSYYFRGYVVSLKGQAKWSDESWAWARRQDTHAISLDGSCAPWASKIILYFTNIKLWKCNHEG